MSKHTIVISHYRMGSQLVVMNVCSFVGRFSSGFLIAPLGLWNLIVASSGCCAIIMFCMTAAHNLAGVMSIGATFGLFSGICEHSYTLSVNSEADAFVDIALVAPMMASLASDRSEIGIRMGVGFTLAGDSEWYTLKYFRILSGYIRRFWRLMWFPDRGCFAHQGISLVATVCVCWGEWALFAWCKFVLTSGIVDGHNRKWILRHDAPVTPSERKDGGAKPGKIRAAIAV